MGHDGLQQYETVPFYNLDVIISVGYLVKENLQNKTIKKEGNESVTICNQLKLVSSDGKRRKWKMVACSFFLDFVLCLIIKRSKLNVSKVVKKGRT